MQRAAELAHASPQGGDAALVAQRPETLQDHHGTDAGILLQQVGDSRLEGIHLGGPTTASRRLHRRVQVLAEGFAGQMKVAGDLAQGPMFAVEEPVNFVKAVGIQHGSFVG